MSGNFIEKLKAQHCGERTQSGDGATHIEIHGNRRNAQKEYNAGWYSLWGAERIKGAFSFGHGTIADLKRYAADNRGNTTFIDLRTGEVL